MTKHKYQQYRAHSTDPECYCKGTAVLAHMYDDTNSILLCVLMEGRGRGVHTWVNVSKGVYDPSSGRPKAVLKVFKESNFQ